MWHCSLPLSDCISCVCQCSWEREHTSPLFITRDSLDVHWFNERSHWILALSPFIIRKMRTKRVHCLSCVDVGEAGRKRGNLMGKLDEQTVTALTWIVDSQSVSLSSPWFRLSLTSYYACPSRALSLNQSSFIHSLIERMNERRDSQYTTTYLTSLSYKDSISELFSLWSLWSLWSFYPVEMFPSVERIAVLEGESIFCRMTSLEKSDRHDTWE